ncbi:STAS domain-containing protein [Streptomyces sp. NPDC049813]|uniref:STAS domain-containing protein n=1 Tax=Streptomyces sp. NPDC049813 TaxID=3365597 RepID=UPI003793B0AA
MRGYFVDELLLITPLRHVPGVRLSGELVGAHKAPLAVAVAEVARDAEEVTIDLTQVKYLANSALETIVALARNLTPPQYLKVLAAPELRVQERLAAAEWDRIETLRLSPA